MADNGETVPVTEREACRWVDNPRSSHDWSGRCSTHDAPMLAIFAQCSARTTGKATDGR